MALDDQGLEDLLEEEFDASSYAPTATFHEPHSTSFVAHVVPPPPPPADIGAPPPYNPQWFPSHPTSAKKSEFGPSVSPVVNTPLAANNAASLKTSKNNNPRPPPRPMRPPPPISANSSSTPNHAFRPLITPEQSGGGGGDDDANNGRGNGNDADANLLPQAPTGKLLAPEERAKAEQEDQKRLEVQSIQKARQMQQEAARKSEERLYHLRLQHEDEQIALRRIEDYQRRRKRQQALAKECARRMTYPPATHESRMPPAEDEAVARELSGLQFRDGWRSVFAAFGVGDPEDFIKSVRADEEFNSYIASTSVRLVDAELVRDFMRMVLEGAPAGPHVRRVVVSPPEQYDPDPAQRVSLFSLGRCLRAVPMVFTSLLSHQWDLLSDARRGNLTEQDWLRLLNTAKAHVSSLLGLSLGALRMKYPVLMSPQSRIKQDPEIETRLFVRECLQQALVGLFDRGLGLFYYQVFADKDKKVQDVAKRFRGKGLVEIAVNLGLNPQSSVAKQLTGNPEMEVGIVHAIRNALEIVCAPSLRLSLFVDCSRGLGSLGVSGDEFLPLFCACLVLGMDTSTKPIKLASLANIMDDFALPEEFRHGESGYVCSTVLTCVEVLLEESEHHHRESTTSANASASIRVMDKSINSEEKELQVNDKNESSSVIKSAVDDLSKTGGNTSAANLEAVSNGNDNQAAEEAGSAAIKPSDVSSSNVEDGTQDVEDIAKSTIDSAVDSVTVQMSFKSQESTITTTGGKKDVDDAGVLPNSEESESVTTAVDFQSNIVESTRLTVGFSSTPPSNKNNTMMQEDVVTFLVLNSYNNAEHESSLLENDSNDKNDDQQQSVFKEDKDRLLPSSLDEDVAKVKSVLAQMRLNTNSNNQDGTGLQVVTDVEEVLEGESEALITLWATESNHLEEQTSMATEATSQTVTMKMLDSMNSGWSVPHKRQWDESEREDDFDSQPSFKVEDEGISTVDSTSCVSEGQQHSLPFSSAAVDIGRQQQPGAFDKEEDQLALDMEGSNIEEEVTKDDQHKDDENNGNHSRSSSSPTTIE